MVIPSDAIFYILMRESTTDPLSTTPSSSDAPRPGPRRSERLRARWDAAVPTLVAIGMGLLAWLGVAFSGARPS